MSEKFKRQIPNILSAIRLIAVPFFIWMFFSGIENSRIYALIIFVAAEFTDILDGWLARRNNWITDIGKLLDPLADKLMQAAAVISLAIRQPLLIWLVIVFVLKELCMLVGACLIIKKRKTVVMAYWFGKMASTVFFCVVTALLIWYENRVVTITLSIILALVLLFALYMYYIKIFKGKYSMDEVLKNESDEKDIPKN